MPFLYNYQKHEYRNNTCNKMRGSDATMKYRSRSDIVAQILTAASVKGGLTKTGIIYDARLSFAQITEYADFLITKAFLSFDSASRRYHTTNKGKEWLASYRPLLTGGLTP